MAFDLVNPAGASIRVSGGHWAVLLTLAENSGWKPAGTKAPRGMPPSETWNGRYDTSDGQTVADPDARRLAEVLHAASVSPQLAVTLSDVIRRIESGVEAAGINIPDQMRMKPEHFSEVFSPLLMFLYQGEFIIK